VRFANVLNWNRKRLFQKSLLLLGAITIASYLATYQSYLQAIIWHKEHGNFIRIGDQEIKLPQYWIDKFSESDGTHIITRASGGFIDNSSTIKFDPIKTGDIIVDEEEIIAKQKRFIELTNRGNSLFVTKQLLIKGKTNTFYCLESPSSAEDISLVCNAARFQYIVIIESPKSREKEIVSVIESLGR